MEGSNLEDVCGQLAEEIAEVLRSRPGKRCRFPAGLRSRVSSYARVCRERGEAIADISGRLGLEMSTLARWLRADQRQPEAGFRPVSIVATEAASHTEGGPGALRLTTPAGYTVDGLDAQTLAFLLRVVG